MTIAIFGFGSPHGDDQIGWWVVDELSKIERLKNQISCMQSNGNGVDWIHQLEDAARVIFIDAVKSGTKPGSLLEISSSDLSSLQLTGDPAGHRYPLSQSIQLAINLSHLTVPYSFYGIEIESVEPFSKMSDSVVNAGTKLVSKLSEGII